MARTEAFAATSIPCAHCGAPVAVAFDASHVTCSYCSRSSPIPEAIRLEIAPRQRALAAEMQAIEGERKDLAMWASAERMMANSPFYGAPAYVPQAVQAPARVADVCPSCGAANAHAPGEQTTRCKHCGADLVASAAALSNQLQSAHVEARRLRMERLRTERHLWMQTRGYPTADLSLVWPLFMIFPASIFLLGMGSAAAEGRGVVAAVMLVLTLCVGIALLGGIAAFIAWKVRSKARFASSVDAFVARVRGQRLIHLADCAGWADRYFAGPFELSWPGSPNALVALVASGFPTLVFADLSPSASWRRRRIAIGLGAVIPSIEAGPSGPPRLLPASDFPPGYRVVAQEGGILAEANEAKATALWEKPETLLELNLLLDAMARAARALGGFPPP